ncbi:MAG: hypothetical protein QXT14_08955 [Candidatus Bathyarchaeia archaeon]
MYNVPQVDYVSYYESEGFVWTIDYDKRIIVVVDKSGNYEVIPFDNVIKVRVENI